MGLNISIGSDHAGFDLKEEIRHYLEKSGHSVSDRGCYSPERTDYPDYAHQVAEDILQGRSGFGVLICGSGNGISMAANKHPGIRAALCWNEEVAALARQHNNANILSLPARFISKEEAQKCVDAFLNAVFEGGRHQQRVEKIDLSC
ncbi:MAG: ribose 5-phosphate isomerase B [Bacteroidia bacterium]|nr:ribose 5-phosphate isomerase B [Bacteroidia bacterium]